MAPPGPLECLALGMHTLRANPRLIFAAWAEMVLVTGLTVAGGALPLAAVGFDRVRAVVTDPERLRSLLLWLAEEARWGDFVPRSPEMIGAWIGLAAAWTLALFVWCWFEAGIFGVLVAAADRTAAGDSAAAFTPGRFRRAAREAFWRIFGLLHAFVLYLLVVQLLWTWVVWLAVRGWEVWGPGALLAIGCGGTLPLACAALVLALWFPLARVEVVRPGVTVRAAQRTSWRVLRRRSGAVLALAALFGVAGLVALGLLTPLSLLVERWLGGPAWWLARGALELLQAGLWGLLGVYTGAVWVSLVRGTVEQDPSAAATTALGEAS